ncbi:hypothetical protein [Pseudothermotoga thermarum]|uniref:Uncharacterized protein n=1 Tax=Pseudothermotoga thermarum DSM 5069 TaxID=688269 RepID=F7YTP6_9THEM|nr:hypothetical protein [Pseudothermotoga thermarum]AEH51268.1 hypothetical protein Theth_1196 [Pseudothermotoga thermarum DSM 5069]
MRKIFVLILVCISLVNFSQDFLARIKEIQAFYDALDLSLVKVSILDAVRISGIKDPMVCYLDLSKDEYVWVVLSVVERVEISAIDGRMLARSTLKMDNYSYSINLQNAISLAILSIGKNVLFAYPTHEGWIVGTKEKVAAVSMKTTAVIWIKDRREYFESLKVQGG